MSGPTLSDKAVESAIAALKRRAEQIVKARPAYREMVDFYLTVFTRQIEWWPKLGVHPEKVERQQVRQCLREGVTLISRYDPGIESGSLSDLWTEMKTVFGRGNDVLRQAVRKIDQAEEAGDFAPASWLIEQRPDRCELLADAADRVGVEESMLGALARAVTYPHWQFVAQSWLPPDRLDEWKRFYCPTCGGPPALAELRKDPPGDGALKTAARLYMHCLFCGSRWVVPTMQCPACGSTESGATKYYFSPDEPELRIDFCGICKHYVKTVDSDKIGGPVHVGLEVLAATHLDAIAQEKKLKPLETHA